MTNPCQHMETAPLAAPSLLEEAAQTRQALEQLKAQLRDSEARYRTLFESLDEGFCIIEKVEGEAGAPPDFRFVEANPAFAAHSGLSSMVGVAGVVGKTMRQLFPGEAEGWLPTYDAICRTGEPIRFEREFVTLGRVLELYAFRVADQTHCRVAVNFHDVTERKQAEQALQQNAGLFATLIEQAPGGVYVVDAQFRLQQVNARAKPAFAAVDPMIGRDFSEVMEILWGPQVGSRLTGIFRHTLATGEPYMSERFTEQRQDIGVEQAYEWETRRITLPDGQHGVACYFYDITERRRAEETAREAQERLHYAANAARLTYVEVDVVKGGARTADNFAAVMGFAVPSAQETDASAGVHALLEHVVPEDRARVQASVEAFISGKPPGKIDYRVLGDDQVERWIESSWFLEHNASGKLLKNFAANIDITERKQAEQLLRQNHDTFFNLIQNAPFGVYVVDSQFRMCQASRASHKAFANIDPLIGRDFEEILRLVWAEPFLSEVHGHFRHTLQTGEAYAAPNTTEQRRDTPDIESYEWKIERITLPDGQFGVVCYFYDITERMQAEQALGELNATLELRVQARTAELSQANACLQAEIAAKERLRESAERLITVAENLSEGLCITSMEGEFIHWNHAALDMHGIASLAESKGQLADFTTRVEVLKLDGSALPLDQWPMSRALRGEQVRDCELLIRRTDTGMARILSYSGTAVRDSAGKQSAFLTVTDITDRKRAEAQLRELNETLERRVLERTQALAELDSRKDEFLAMLGHELRNPLAALTNAVQLMRQHKHVDPLLLQGRAIIGRQLGHLTHLVDDLLEVARINSGSVQLRQQTVKLSGIVERALETAQPMILQHRHQLTLALPPEPIFLHADAARLEQVLVNLLTNAAKYTDDGGRIDLSVGQDGNEAVLKVRDNGIGIAPELLPHIFDLFTQAERSLDRAQGGLGIGLCLVQRLVQLHGGSVQAHSVLGQGSEFVVRLPLLPAAPELPESPTAPTLPESSAPASDSAPPPEKASSGCRVLVVDDNVDAAQSMAKLLERTGHATRLAYDGTSALQAAIDYRPEVVLLDIGLPGLDGYQVAERIRQHATLKNIVLVALTGYGQDSDRQRSQKAGFDHHLVKPSDFDDIENILAGVASLRKA